MQHDIALLLRDAITVSEFGSQAELARRSEDVTYDRLRGVLSGDVWMRLVDVADVANALGLDIELSIGARST